MLDIKEVKKVIHLQEKFIDPTTIYFVIAAAEMISKFIEKRHRYTCGLEEIKVTEQGKAFGFFQSPDGQNGEFFYALIDAGFRRHFYQAEYYWAVAKGDIILQYTEGDISIFKKPEGYKAPKI
ncbi:hypothetical protein [Caudoviricetes sp.]|nr:hypothetical protein [Caudoviricetes sp.]